MQLLGAALCMLVGTYAVMLSAKIVEWIRCTRLLRTLPGPEGYPVLGQLQVLASPQHHIILAKWAAELGGIYRMRLAHLNAVVVTDPYLIAEILGKNTEIEKSIAGVYSKFNVLLHAGGMPNIFTSPTDDYWRLIRKGVAPAFSPKNIRNGFGHVVQVNRQLISILQDKQGLSVDMDNASLRVTLDVIGRVGFGKDFGATKDLTDGKANRAFDLMAAGRDEGIKRFSNPLRPYLQFLPSVRQGERDFCAFRAIMADLLKEIHERGEPSDLDTTIAAHLLRIRDPQTCRPLPDDRLAAEIGVFFTGGFETTGHTIAWALFMISQHKAVEAKVIAELQALGLMPTAGQPQPRILDYDDIARLVFTGNAIKEHGTNRTTTKDTWLGSHLIPRGTMVWVPLKGTFCSPHNWDRPDVFIPERWEQPGTEYALPRALGSAAIECGPGEHATAYAASAITPAAGELKSVGAAAEATRVKRFLPFSTGMRDCVGQNLARMNYTTTVAMLIAHFKFELAPEAGGYQGVLASQSSALTTLQPASGLFMRCLPRKCMT